MTSNREPSCVVTDKELTLQILTTNCIPTIEVVDGRKGTFPVVGRMHGHHEGKDIAMIENSDQVREEGFDYYTRLYSFTREFRIEVIALSIGRIEEAVASDETRLEMPIRTRAFGWSWEEVDSFDAEWLQCAVRSLYVLGLSNGFVKIGILEDGSPIVIDVNPPVQWIPEPVIAPPSPCEMGADVEFMLDHKGDLVPASRFFPVESNVGCDERQIEQDSGVYALAELRPRQAESPHELFANIRDLLMKASLQVPYEDISFRAGSMPFSGYQCGGHIHFGLPLSLSLLRALDVYLAIPLAMIEDSRTAKRRRRTKHGGLGRYRLKPYGFEYLSLSSWLIDPDITLAVLCLAQIVSTHHHQLPKDVLFDPLVQRAYYGGNRLYLKYNVWPGIKREITNTTSYMEYTQELSALFDSIENERTIDDSQDIRESWGASVEDGRYDAGLTIRISKKMRNKFNLKIGQSTYIRTKKSIMLATVETHPFAFRNSNAVQLSPSLCKALSLPTSWYPQIFQNNDVLSLGPIIGIMASRPFMGQSTYFRHLCRLGKAKQVFVYVFEPQDIDWDKLLIKGDSEQGNGVFPFPDVIYDRYFVGGNSKNYDIHAIRMKFQSIYNIAFINPPSLIEFTADKWRCHEVLSETHKDSLPVTRLLENTSDALEFVQQFDEVYIKPVHGALGTGVLRLFHQPAGLFCMSSSTRELKRVENEEQLLGIISPLTGNNDYLVQEGIARRQLDGRLVEVRIYMQKNSDGKWMRTGMVARLCQGGILTEGTELNMRVSEVLLKLYPNVSQRQRVHDELAQIARSVVSTVEATIGEFGELAIDICIDQSDSIKVLELNSKPDTLFSAIKAFKLRNLAAYRLLNYAASLAGYVSTET